MILNPLNSKILIIGPAWVGDMVMAQSLFVILKKHFPDFQIDVLAPAWVTPLLERMSEVSQVIEMPASMAHGKLALFQRYKMGVALRSQGYAKAYLLPNSFKSALIPFWANIPERIGYKGEFRYGILTDVRILDKQKFPKMVQRFAALGYSAQENQDPNFLPDCPEPKLNYIPPFKKPLQRVLALCPGAEFGGAKRWPEKYYAQVANEKIKQGWIVWILGSKNDQTVAKNIVDKINLQSACIDFTGKTKLSEAIDLLGMSDLVLANDSGLMHTAAALSKNLIALYGPTTPEHAPPLSSKAIVMYEKLACSPCKKRECPLKGEKYHGCMESLMPEKVLEQINKLCEF